MCRAGRAHLKLFGESVCSLVKLACGQSPGSGLDTRWWPGGSSSAVALAPAALASSALASSAPERISGLVFNSIGQCGRKQLGQAEHLEARQRRTTEIF